MSKDEYQNLKETYSFNIASLKDLYLSEAINVFQKYQLLSKINNIIIFRKKYEDKLPFPQLLFHNNDYHVTKYLPVYKSIITQVCSISTTEIFKTTAESQADLSNMLCSIFTILNNSSDTQNYLWIIDFFIYSAFPAIYGHFCSYEYLQEGFSFISLFINDPLAPRLVGSLFNHSYIFKDRFIQDFFHNLANTFISNQYSYSLFDNFDEARQLLLQTFFNSFKSCLLYFTEFHFQAIKLLRDKRGVQSAIQAIFDYFILDGLLDVWHYSPYFASTKFLEFGKSKNILFSSFVKDRNSQKDDLFLPYIDLLCNRENDQHFAMPKIADIIFFKGEIFSITKFDMIVGNIIYAYLKLQQKDHGKIPNNEEIVGQIKRMPCFTIKPRDLLKLTKKSISIVSNFRFLFNKQSDFPKQPDPKSSFMTVLEYRRDVHEYLYNLSGHLSIPRFAVKCIKNCLCLTAASYANWLYNSTLSKHSRDTKTNYSSQPIEYAYQQRTSMIMYNLIKFFKYNSALLIFIRDFLKEGFPNALLGDISNNLTTRLNVSWEKLNRKGFVKTIKSKYGSSLIGETKTIYSISTEDISKAIVSTIETVLNNWKTIYNQVATQNSKAASLLNLGTLSIENFQPYLDIFIFATNEIARHFVYIAMSKKAHPILPIDNSKDKRRIMEFQQILTTNSSFLVHASLSEIMNDPYISIKIDTMKPIQFYLQMLEESFKRELTNKSEQFNLGWKISSFLFVEKMLRSCFDDTNIHINTKKMLMTAIYKGQEPIYTRLNLINISKIICAICVKGENTSQIQGQDNYHDLQIEEEKYLGNMLKGSVFDIFGHGIFKKFQNLNLWYSLDICS